MSKKEYSGIISVKVTTPKGYSPRSKTYRMVVYTDDKSQKSINKLVEEFTVEITTAMEQNNKGVELKYSTSISSLTEVHCLKYNISKD